MLNFVIRTNYECIPVYTRLTIYDSLDYECTTMSYLHGKVVKRL